MVQSAPVSESTTELRSVRLVANVEPSLHEQIRGAAQREQRTVSDQVRILLGRALKESTKP